MRYFERQKKYPENRPLLIDNFRSHDDILRFVKAVCGAEGMIPDFMDLKGKQAGKLRSIAKQHSRVMVRLTAVEKKGTNALQKRMSISVLQQSSLPTG